MPFFASQKLSLLTRGIFHMCIFLILRLYIETYIRKTWISPFDLAQK